MFNFIKQLLDWIYHRNCYFCHKRSIEGMMCGKCFEEIEINFPEPVKVIDGIKIYSTSLYVDNLKKLIRGLKFHNKKELAIPLAQALYIFWQKLELDNQDFEIVPMPLYPTREKQRGYNHMALVAEEFSKLTGYQVNNSIVKRVKDTKPQYKLKLRERRENLKNAFEVYPEEYNGKKLLLLDDICTTGSTLEELITTFKKHKINSIFALVSAIPESTSYYQY